MAQFTETELTEIGRAMERAGFDSLEAFVTAAVTQKKQEVLKQK